MCNIITYGFTLYGNLQSISECNAYTSDIIGAQVQVQFESSEVGKIVIASVNILKDGVKLNPKPLISQEYTVPYANAMAILDISFNGLSITPGTYTFIYGASVHSKDFSSQYCYAITSSKCTTLNLCTPNWQCEQPLNGYEKDGCGNRRLNSICQPSVVPKWKCSDQATNTCIRDDTNGTFNSEAECKASSICQPSTTYHNKCINDICTKVSGGGKDECTNIGSSCKQQNNNLIYIGLAAAGASILYFSMKKK